MHHNYFRSFVFYLIAIVSIPAIAQENTLENGEYLTEGGWGRLTISEQKNKRLFSIFASGTNGHTCDISGGVRGNLAVLSEDEQTEPACIVKFDKKSGAISVLPSDYCHGYYCGMRASFGGEYFKPNKGCSSAEQGARYEAFKAFYDKKSYALALKESQTLLRDCKKFTDWIGKDNLKNDIAITQFHLRDKAGCLKTLKSIEANPEYAFAPMEADIVESITKAKKANQKLCNSLK